MATLYISNEFYPMTKGLSFAQALTIAQDGDILELMAGDYSFENRENLLLLDKRKLTFKASTNAHVTIQGTWLIQSCQLTFINIMFHFQNILPNTIVLHSENSQLTFKNCGFWGHRVSQSTSCKVVFASSHVTLNNTSSQYNVSFQAIDHTQLEVNELHAQQHEKSAILLVDNAKLMLTHSHFSNCQCNAILGKNHATISVTNCEFLDFGKLPIMAVNQANLIVKKSTFTHAIGNGIYAQPKANVTLTDCQFSQFQDPVVWAENIKLVIQSCDFANGQSNVLNLRNLVTTGNELYHCTFSDFALPMVWLENVAITLRANTFRHNNALTKPQSHAICARQQSQVIIEQGEFSEFEKKAVLVFEKSHLQLSHAKFSYTPILAQLKRNATCTFVDSPVIALDFNSNFNFTQMDADNMLIDLEFIEAQQAKQKALQGFVSQDTHPILDMLEDKDGLSVEQLLAFEQGYRELNSLVALDTIKQEVDNFIAQTNNQKRRQRLNLAVPILPSLHLVLTGNTGTGKTSVARLLAKIYFGVGRIKTDTVVETNPAGLLRFHLGLTAENVNETLKSVKNGVLVIDKPYLLLTEGTNGQVALDEILTFMENHQDSMAVILTGQTDLMQSFIRAYPALDSRFVRRLQFDDYPASALFDICMRLSAGYYQFEPESIALLNTIFDYLYNTRDATFSNGRAVKNLLTAITAQQAIRLAKLPRESSENASDLETNSNTEMVSTQKISVKKVNLMTIQAVDITLALTEMNFAHILTHPDVRQTALQQGMKELQALIGLDAVKAEIGRLQAFIQMQKKKKQAGMNIDMLPSLHLVFTGNPGTGKTTVARIIAKIYYGMGLINSDKILETDRSGLVGKYIGHTAQKTLQQLIKAKDGVLFIDEAYTLARSQDSKDFGQEAIDTLLKYMEDHRGEMAVIVAGYTHLMENFITSNPGLASRFSRKIHFADYNAEDLFYIFEKYCLDNDYRLMPQASDLLFRHFVTISQQRHPNFSNGRMVRNLFNAIIEQQSKRLYNLTDTTLNMLSLIQTEDVMDVLALQRVG